MRRWLLVLLLLSAAAAARAQAWQRDSVLSQLRATVIVADPAGFLWVSAETGVFRYDGHQAVPLNDLLAPGSPRLPTANAHLLFRPDGALWCGTQWGLFRFVPATCQLERVALPALPNGQVSIYGMNPDDAHPGRVWVSYGGALVQLAGTRAVGPPTISTSQAFGTDYDGAGATYHLADSRITWQTISRLGMDQPTTTFRWRVPGSGGRWQIDFGALYDVQGTPPGAAPRAIARWDTTAAGVNHFRPVAHGGTWYWLSLNRQLVALTPQPHGRPPRVELLTSAERAPVTRVQASANGVLWACDPLLGTYRFSLHRWPVQALTVRPVPGLNPRLMSFRSITRLPAPDGRLLVASYQGLFTQAADSPTAPLHQLPLRGTPMDFDVHDLLRTRTGQLLAANEAGIPVGELDVAHRQYRPFQWLKPAHTLSGGSCLFEDHAGRLWVGTSAGLYAVDTAHRTLTRYHDADVRYPLHPCLIEQLAEAPAGVLWAATSHGLFRLTVATGELRHYGPDEKEPARRLPSTLTLCVRAPHPDSVWVSTRDQGLLLLTPRRGLVRQLTPADGLPNPAVASILPDAQPGVLWLGTFGGLARYTVRTGQVLRFGAADGLAATDLNRQSAWRDPVSGWVYFGGVGGLTRVAPAGPAPLAAPRLLLTGVRQHVGAADTVLTRYFDGNPPAVGLQLAAADGFVELALALADQTSAEPPHYTYRLIGEADRQFRPVTGYRLRLDRLTPGDYVVEVKGQTAHGVEARNVLRIPLRVAGYWWRHPLAWAVGSGLLAALAALAVYFWQRQRTARLLREHALRARIAADLHDDVGNLLTQISMQSSLLREKQHAPDQLLARLDRLATTARQAAQQMNDVIWGLGDESQTVAQLITRMRDHAYEMLAPTGIELDFQEEGAVSGADLPLEIRQNLYLIFKEALHNVVKHAQATQVEVRFSRAAGRVELLVHDNGRSYAGAGRPGGNGLRNMRTRAEALGGQLDAQPQAQGFRVHVWLPA